MKHVHPHCRGRVEFVVMLAVALTAGVVSMSVGLHQRHANLRKATNVVMHSRSAPLPRPERPAAAPQAQPIAAQQMAGYLPRDNYTAAPMWTPATAMHQPTPAWANTTSLVEQVERLRREIPREPWPNYVLDALARLQTFDPAQEQDAIDELVLLANSPPSKFNDDPLGTRIQSTCHAVRRRAEVWQQLHHIATVGERSAAAEINPYAMWVQIQETVDAIPHPQALAWREYLQMDELEVALRREPATSDELAQMARRVLEQLHSPRLGARQRALLRCPEVDHLSAMLRACASRPGDVAAVVNAIERYEQTGDEASGGDLARLAREMRWSVDPAVAELARRIDTLYRGPNMRVSISGELLNRLLSEPLTSTAPLQQQTAQARIVGERTCSTDLSVELLPADDGWRARLLAAGTVTADATVMAGAATFFVAGNGNFQASKRLSFDNSQVDLDPAQATGDFDMSLSGYQTSMDALPLVRRVARDTALAQFQQQQAAAQQQAQKDVRDEAKRTLDEQVAAFIGDAGSRLEAHALAPLRNLGLPLTPMRLETTSERLVGDYRLAGQDHLGAHAPPPIGLSDNLVSLQIHQSAINNTLGRMKLAGRSGDLQQIGRDVCGAWGLPQAPELEQVPTAISLRFASEQPLRVDFRDGEAQVAVRLAGFSIADKQFGELTIRCAYRLDAQSQRPALVRVGKVEVAGSQLGIMDQIILDRIFARLAAAADRIPLLPEQLAAHPGLAGAAITQSHLADGWLALAIEH